MKGRGAKRDDNGGRGRGASAVGTAIARISVEWSRSGLSVVYQWSISGLTSVWKWSSSGLTV
eukprot:2700685-Prorocentrum_lima.AAC.1